MRYSPETGDIEDDIANDGAGFREDYMAMNLGKSVKETIDLTVQMNVWTSGEAQIVEINKTEPNFKDKDYWGAKPEPNICDTGGIQEKAIAI